MVPVVACHTVVGTVAAASFVAVASVVADIQLGRKLLDRGLGTWLGPGLCSVGIPWGMKAQHRVVGRSFQ